MFAKEKTKRKEKHTRSQLFRWAAFIVNPNPRLLPPEFENCAQGSGAKEKHAVFQLHPVFILEDSSERLLVLWKLAHTEGCFLNVTITDGSHVM